MKANVHIEGYKRPFSILGVTLDKTLLGEHDVLHDHLLKFHKRYNKTMQWRVRNGKYRVEVQLGDLARKRIKDFLDKNVAFNIFGYINAERLRAEGEVPEEVTDKTLREFIKTIE